MALTARNTVGFERCYNTSGFKGNPVACEGATATTYTEGRLVAKIPAGGTGAGLLVNLTSTMIPNASLPIVGVVAATKVTTDTDKMVKVNPVMGEVFTVSFDGHLDVSCGAASTVANQFKLAVQADASSAGPAAGVIGGLLHIYEGPGKGESRVISSLTTGAANTAKFTVSGAFSALPTTASKAIALLHYTTTDYHFTKPSNKGSLLKLSANSAAKVSCRKPTFDDAYLSVINIDAQNLTMDVMIAPAKANITFGQTAT